MIRVSGAWGVGAPPGCLGCVCSGLFCGCFCCLAVFFGLFGCWFGTELLLNSYCFARGVSGAAFGGFPGSDSLFRVELRV